MTINQTKTSARGRSQSKGLGLIEIMVALALAGILMLGLAEIFVSNVKDATATASLADLEDTGRVAVQLLSTDVRRAGFLGGNLLVSPITGTMTPTASSSVCPSNSRWWGRMLEQPLFGLDDTDTGYDCVSDIAPDEAGAYLRGDILTVRYGEALPSDPNSISVGSDSTRLYLRTTVVDGRLFKGADQADADNVITHAAAEVHGVVSHAYYVGSSGRQCQGADIPALFRVSLEAGWKPVAQELMAGVEHLQFRYQVGRRYLDADELSLADWSNVTAVEIFTLVRSECPEAGFVNNRTFTLGDLGVDAYGPADGYRRQLYVNVAAIRN